MGRHSRADDPAPEQPDPQTTTGRRGRSSYWFSDTTTPPAAYRGAPGYAPAPDEVRETRPAMHAVGDTENAPRPTPRPRRSADRGARRVAPRPVPEVERTIPAMPAPSAPTATPAPPAGAAPQHPHVPASPEAGASRPRFHDGDQRDPTSHAGASHSAAPDTVAPHAGASEDEAPDAGEHASDGAPSADEPSAPVSRTTSTGTQGRVSSTGRHSTVGSTGGHRAVTSTGGHRTVSSTGSHRAVTSTGGHRTVTSTGSHRAVETTSKRRRVAAWPIACGILVVLIVAGIFGWNWADGVLSNRAEAQAAACQEGTATLRVATAPGAADAVRQAAKSWNADKTVVHGHCIDITVQPGTPQVVFDDLTGNRARGTPAAWIMDDPSWTEKLESTQPERIGASPETIAETSDGSFTYLSLAGDGVDSIQQRAAQSFQAYLAKPAQQKAFAGQGGR